MIVAPTRAKVFSTAEFHQDDGGNNNTDQQVNQRAWLVCGCCWRNRIVVAHIHSRIVQVFDG